MVWMQQPEAEAKKFPSQGDTNTDLRSTRKPNNGFSKKEGMSSGAAGDTQGKEEVTFTGARLGAAGCSQHTAGNQETQRDIRPEGNGNISDSTEPDGNSSPHRGKRKTISDK